jgi:dTDP-4-dehydrorhamnose reductase
MKLWITGANGFLGQALQRVCKNEGVAFVATSKKEVDISSWDQINRFDLQAVTHIVNSAALAQVDLAEKNPELAFQVNVLGPENLGKWASSKNIPIVHVSTEYIFNGCLRDTPYAETDLPAPVGVYAATKREGEERLLMACPRGCVLRTSWLFGGHGKTFLSSLYDRIKNEKTLHVAADQKGRATYIDDLIKAIFSLLDHPGIFHFANQGMASRYEIALAMQKYALESEISINCDEIIPTTTGHHSHLNKRPTQCILDTSKYENLFPIRSWKEAVKDLINKELICR